MQSASCLGWRFARVALVGLLAVAAVGTNASAHDRPIMSLFTNPAGVQFSDGNAHVLAQRTFVVDDIHHYQIVIVFNAECSVAANDTTTWLDIDIRWIRPGLPDLIVPPSNGDNAFCTSTGDNTLTRWVSAATYGFLEIPIHSGNEQTLRVTGTLRGFTTGEIFRIDDVFFLATAYTSTF